MSQYPHTKPVLIKQQTILQYRTNDYWKTFFQVCWVHWISVTNPLPQVSLRSQSVFYWYRKRNFTAKAIPHFFGWLCWSVKDNLFFIADTFLAICLNICVKHLEETLSYYYYYLMRYNYVRMMVVCLIQ